MSSFNGDRYFFDCKPDCPDRDPYCHGRCESYLTKRAKLDKINEEKFKKREAEAYVVERTVKKRSERAVRLKNESRRKIHP